jgi:hypothetical protein
MRRKRELDRKKAPLSTTSKEHEYTNRRAILRKYSCRVSAKERAKKSRPDVGKEWVGSNCPCTCRPSFLLSHQFSKVNGQECAVIKLCNFGFWCHAIGREDRSVDGKDKKKKTHIPSPILSAIENTTH